MNQLKWINRKFDFGFQKEYLPFMIERVKATSARIAEMIEGKSEAELSRRNGNEWSVKEHIGHLIDLEELHSARVDQFKEGLTELQPADMSNKKTYEANHNLKSTGDLLAELKTVRRHFIKAVLEIKEEKLEHKAMHPRLRQQISITDLVYFVAEHDNQHLTIMGMLLKD